MSRLLSNGKIVVTCSIATVVILAVGCSDGTFVSGKTSGPLGAQDVSLINLIATPEKFEGKHVRVSGYVHLEFEGNAIYLDRESMRAMLTKNALALSLGPGVSTNTNDIS